MRTFRTKVGWLMAALAVAAIVVAGLQAGVVQYLLMAVAAAVCLVLLAGLSGRARAGPGAPSRLPVRKVLVAALLLAGVGLLVLLVLTALRHRNLLAGAAAALFIVVLVRALNDLFGANRRGKDGGQG